MGRAKREVPTGKLILKYPKTGYDKSKEYTLYYYWKSPVCVTPEAQVPLTLESKFRMTPIKS